MSYVCNINEFPDLLVESLNTLDRTAFLEGFGFTVWGLGSV